MLAPASRRLVDRGSPPPTDKSYFVLADVTHSRAEANSATPAMLSPLQIRALIAPEGPF
jgi:hypothetical protein